MGSDDDQGYEFNNTGYLDFVPSDLAHWHQWITIDQNVSFTTILLTILKKNIIFLNKKLALAKYDYLLY